jgi:hypothetical protein
MINLPNVFIEIAPSCSWMRPDLPAGEMQLFVHLILYQVV